MLRRLSQWLQPLRISIDLSVSKRRRACRGFKPLLEVLEERLAPAVVTNDMDLDSMGQTVPGSLRAAIQVANTTNDRAITFDLVAAQGLTIDLNAALPAITASGVSINGFTQPGTPAGIFGIIGISGPGGLVFSPTASGAEVQGLNISVSGDGILLESSNNLIHNNQITQCQNGVRMIQGASANAVFDNLLSSNGGAGVVISDAGTSGNHVKDNQIGINAFLGDLAEGNAEGVLIENGATGNLIGGSGGASPEGNTIAANSYGVEITGTTTTDNTVTGNEIGAATTALTGGVDLFSGPTAPVSNSFAGVYITGGAGGNFIGPGPSDPTDPGNLISGNEVNGAAGVLVSDAGSGNVITSNLIGTNGAGDGASNGFSSLGNYIGVEISGSSTVSTQVLNNLISNNTTDGVQLINFTSGTLVQGNSIGTNDGATAPLGNGAYGVDIFLQASSNTINNNTIGGNGMPAAEGPGGTGAGVYIQGDGTTANVVMSNTIGDAVFPNEGNGVTIIGASGNTVLSNVIGDNASDGVEVDTGTANIVEENQLIFSGFDGLLLLAATGTNANSNLISGNKIEGVEITGGTTTTTLKGNLIGTDPAGTAEVDAEGKDWGNAVQGVLIQLSSNNTVTGNTISGNQNGVVISDPSGSSNLNQETNNTIELNNIGTDNTGKNPVPNHGDGIGLFGQGVSGNIVNENTSEFNVSSGLDFGNHTSGNTANENNLIANQGDGVLFQSDATGNTVSGSFMSGNALNGVEMNTGANKNEVKSSYIGTDVTGLLAQGNDVQGVLINGADNNTISDNVVSANQNGIVLLTTSGNTIQGNLVGTDYTSKKPLPNAGDGILLGLSGQAASSNTLSDNIVDFNKGNGVHIVAGQGNTVTGSSMASNSLDGVFIETGAPSNTIGGTASGDGNFIDDNGIDGVRVDASKSNSIRENAIYGNAHLGIELTNGGNAGIGTPVVTLVSSGNNQTTVTIGNGGPTGQLIIDAFLADSSSPPQGGQFLGTATVTTGANGAFTITLPGAVPSGTVIVVTATDTNGDTSQFSVPLVPTAPAVTSANNTTFATGAAGSFNVTASGFPTPSLTETGALPGGVTFVDQGNGTAKLSGTPNAGTAGTYQFTITAANGVSPNATQTFTLTVNQAPAITSSNNTTFTVGSAGTFTITTTGSPKPSLTESGTLPGGVTFVDQGNGTAKLSGTPNAGTTGTYQFTITAANGVSPNAQQTFILTVNQAPAITSGNSTTFTVGTAGTFTVTTTGNPKPSLTESGTLPGGVTFVDQGNGTATLSGTPNAGTGGTYQCTVTAANGVSPNATQTFTLTVDQAPAITSSNSTTFTVGTAGSFTVTTTGSPTPALSETGNTLPSGVTYKDNGNGTATLSGTASATGTFVITIKAANGVGSAATQTFTLTLSAASLPPSITSANNTTFTVGTAGSFTVTTGGNPLPALSETGNTLPSGVTFKDNGNGTATLGGTPAASGTFVITIKAANGIGSNATQTFTLTVNPANAAPAITSANNTTFSAGTAGSFTVTTTGYPLPTLTESGNALPSGVTFKDNGNGTGTLGGTTSASGTYVITIVAANGIGSAATQSFTLTVSAASVPPSITSANNTTFTVGTAASFTVTTGGNPLPALSETGNTLPSGVTFKDNGNGTATLGGTPAASGTFVITIKAANGIGSNATQTFTLTVNPANAAPAITSANNAMFSAGTAGSFTVTTTGYPLPTLTESGNALPSGVTFKDNGNGTATLGGTTSASGTFVITLVAANGIGSNATQTFTLTVVQTTPLSITTTTLPTYFTQGQNYSATIATNGGVAPITFSLSTGTLPAGLTLAPSTGVISGTPTVFGTSTFTVQAQGASGAPATQAYTVVIVAPEFAYNPTTQTLVITLSPTLPSFTFAEATTATANGTSTVYTLTLGGSSASPITQTFTDAQLTTSPASGMASVSVIGLGGLAGTAILITNDTYVQNGQTLQTPARISLGSLTDAGVGTISKFVGNNLNSPEYPFLSLEGFPLSYAYAGRNDGTIQLFGTENTGKVGFVTAGYYSYIASAVTGVYAHFGEGTPEVIGTSAGNAADFAYHYTSSAPSTVSTITSVFTVNGITSSSMAGGQTNPEDNGNVDTFDNIANGFVLNTAVAYSGNSIAHINDSPLSDTYVGLSTDPLGLGSIGGIAGFSYMYVGAFPNYNEFDVAYGFGTYFASSTMGGHDIDYPGAPANNVFTGNWIQSFR